MGHHGRDRMVVGFITILTMQLVPITIISVKFSGYFFRIMAIWHQFKKFIFHFCLGQMMITFIDGGNTTCLQASTIIINCNVSELDSGP
jgi:hypothetical protein